MGFYCDRFRWGFPGVNFNSGMDKPSPYRIPVDCTFCTDFVRHTSQPHSLPAAGRFLHPPLRPSVRRCRGRRRRPPAYRSSRASFLLVGPPGLPCHEEAPNRWRSPHGMSNTQHGGGKELPIRKIRSCETGLKNSTSCNKTGQKLPLSFFVLKM